ncbi:MAG TPA: ankyrin repeat domain-containing protein, partial [Synergistaceae bacterium]|nr:ankyrin repeat domain-containing protein [Synergistaceae bacterium]
LESGADVDARDNQGVTALMGAAEFCDNPEILEILLQAGADPGAKDTHGRSVLDCAQENDALRGTEVLRKLEVSSPS